VIIPALGPEAGRMGDLLAEEKLGVVPEALGEGLDEGPLQILRRQAALGPRGAAVRPEEWRPDGSAGPCRNPDTCPSPQIMDPG